MSDLSGQVWYLHLPVQPRTLAHWHVAVRRVALARVVALAVSPCCFCAPLALESEPQLLFGPFPQSQTR